MLLGHLLMKLFSKFELLILCSELLQHLGGRGGEGEGGRWEGREGRREDGRKGEVDIRKKRERELRGRAEGVADAK